MAVRPIWVKPNTGRKSHGWYGHIKRFEITQRFQFADGYTSGAFDEQLPPYSVIDTLLIKVKTAVDATTATEIGIGVSGDLDEFAEVPITEIDAADDVVVYHTTDPVGTALSGAGSAQTISSSAQTVLLAPTSGSGTGAGDINSGDILVTLCGYQIIPLPANDYGS